jgi:hypothetical protein
LLERKEEKETQKVVFLSQVWKHFLESILSEVKKAFSLNF